MNDRQSLHGRHLLILEDDYFSATTLADYLVAHGARIVGPVSNVGDALDAIDTCGPLDGAILDVSLQDGDSYAVVDKLRQRDVPSLFVTGYERDDLPAAYSTMPLLAKPFGLKQMLDAILKELPRG